MSSKPDSTSKDEWIETLENSLKFYQDKYEESLNTIEHYNNHRQVKVLMKYTQHYKYEAYIAKQEVKTIRESISWKIGNRIVNIIGTFFSWIPSVKEKLNK